MNYHLIRTDDMLNGDGLRVILFVSGCEHHCAGCHNPQTWDTESGKPFTSQSLQELMQLLSVDYISGLTISGGDPLLLHNRDEVLLIAKLCKQYYPNKTVWLYTGFEWEDICYLSIMRYVDVLVDGQYIKELNSPNQPWVGSSNQRVIDVNKTLRDPINNSNRKIVLHK